MGEQDRRAGDEQALGESDQTHSDADQTWADHDQSDAEQDQLSSDEDQLAADRDVADGVDPRTHERTSAARARSSRDRAEVGRLRDETAQARDETSTARDRTAEIRDRLIEESAERTGVDDIARELLRRAQADRQQAALDRARAAADRQRAAADRQQAALDREAALRERAEVRSDLARAGTDELTGVWTRPFGLATIKREIERVRRSDERLVLAFVDVDGLKEVNETRGYAEGDRLLRLVADTLRRYTRPYDVLVRYGGDEFLCALTGISVDDANGRLQAVAGALSAADERHSISFGVAAHEPADQVADLVGRADMALLTVRQARERR